MGSLGSITMTTKIKELIPGFNNKYYQVLVITGKNYYDEGIFLGYRWHEKMNIKPLFAFGHGLSYTQFEYGSVSCKVKKGNVIVKVPVTNVGKVAGAEVVQVYVRDCEASVEMPNKQLKGFDKVYLEPGQTKTVEICLEQDAFRFFDEQTMAWKVEPGDFEILVCSSSDDVRGSSIVTLSPPLI